MLKKTPQMILAFLAICILSGAFCIVSSYAQQQKKKTDQKENYNRPGISHQIKPTIPDANRYQEDKVFLENADSLYRPPFEFEEKQIVKGNVKFRQGGMWMYCDSAYYFPERNSLDAFGHVVMQQGDTLFVYADKLNYDGGVKHAVLRKGETQQQVMLKDSKVTLTTDSLDYDLVTDLGWYSVGGTLDDGVNTLTSIYGEYSPSTKLAEFRQDVVLVNNKDGYKMFTEKLFYNTQTNIANIDTQTRIEGSNDTILTTQGWYDTRSDHAQLTSRSTIYHKDSSNNVVTLEGDSLIYDKIKHISEAYMFRDRNKLARPIVLTDTARKTKLYGGYGRYNDSLQQSMATDYPLLIEYSRPDTLFLRSDTIRTYMRTEKVWPDSLNHDWDAATRARLRSYSSLEELLASMEVKCPTLPSNFAKPGMQSELMGFENITLPKVFHHEQVELVSADTIQNREREPMSKELLNPAEGEPQSESADMLDQLVASEPDHPEEWLDELIAEQREKEAPQDKSVEEVVIPQNPDFKRPLDALGRDSSYMVDKQFNVARAIGKARFFNQQMQGIADTILYHQYDSMLYLLRKPIVWSGERQVFGDSIKVHFRDSVAEWAHLPVGGMVIEHIDEDFYNQLSGREIMAYFDNNELKHLYVQGNVETIFLPMEKDSTYNKLVHAESSYLTVDMDGKDMKKLKMWPAVEGETSPIFLIKKNEQKFLQGFKWMELLRPVREWYGDRVKWEDELGEVPDELIEYFKE